MGMENGTVGDEINLWDIWRLIVRRRMTALVALFLVGLSTGIYLLLTKPEYEAKGSLYIRVSVEPPTLVAQRLHAVREKHGDAAAWIKDVVLDRKDPRLITFTVRGTSPKAVQQVGEEAINSVLNEQADKREGEVLRQELQDLRKLDQETRSMLAKLKGQSQAYGYSNSELGSIRMRIWELERNLGARESSTEVIQAPGLPKEPVSPKTRPIIALALVAGLLLALVSVFVAEAVAKRRRV
jgi:uncharacterized protein involved in exopolysaccharide biosynthesis